MAKVFVYGTLKQGHGNNQHYLKEAQFLGKGHILGFDLFDLGAFPAIVHQQEPHNTPVHGEIYEVTPEQLLSVDGLEGFRNGYSGFYDRKEVIVYKEDKTKDDVLVYFMHEQPNNSVKVDEGNWQ